MYWLKFIFNRTLTRNLFSIFIDFFSHFVAASIQDHHHFFKKYFPPPSALGQSGVAPSTRRTPQAQWQGPFYHVTVSSPIRTLVGSIPDEGPFSGRPASHPPGGGCAAHRSGGSSEPARRLFFSPGDPLSACIGLKREGGDQSALATPARVLSFGLRRLIPLRSHQERPRRRPPLPPPALHPDSPTTRAGLSLIRHIAHVGDTMFT